MLIAHRPREVTIHTLPTATIQFLAPFGLLFSRSVWPQVQVVLGAILAWSSEQSLRPCGSWVEAHEALSVLPSRSQQRCIEESGSHSRAFGFGCFDTKAGVISKLNVWARRSCKLFLCRQVFRECGSTKAWGREQVSRGALPKEQALCYGC